MRKERGAEVEIAGEAVVAIVEAAVVIAEVAVEIAKSKAVS